MKRKRLSPKAPCGCGSHKSYRNCCWHKNFKWMVDSKGRLGRAMALHPVVKEVLAAEDRWFEEVFERKPTNKDGLLFDRMRDKYRMEEMSELMLAADIPPEFIYAFQKTGLLVTAMNKNLLPDCDLEEWHNAIEEFKSLRLSKEDVVPSKAQKHLLEIVARLETEYSNGIRILQRIIQEHGIAKNIKGPRKTHTFYDFLFLGYTKALKTFKAIRTLSESGYGEDALTLVRTVFEIYVTTAFLLNNPAKITDLVVAPIRLKCGLCERVSIAKEGGGQRRVLRDLETGAIYPVRISISERTSQSYDPLDAKVYSFLYRYMSDFVHSNIEVMENYLDGHFFDDRSEAKTYHALLYSTLSMALIFEGLLVFKKFKRQFRKDLGCFIRRTAEVLRLAITEMTAEKNRAAVDALK